tara:strand:- start:243 stop:566 length:324 start_codon:yes stop_codon:yes gene_type:complete
MDMKKKKQAVETNSGSVVELKHSSVGRMLGGPEPKLVLPGGLVFQLRQPAIPALSAGGHANSEDQAVSNRANQAGLVFYRTLSRFTPDGPKEEAKLVFTPSNQRTPH